MLLAQASIRGGEVERFTHLLDEKEADERLWST
jgi:hypothetical protein